MREIMEAIFLKIILSIMYLLFASGIKVCVTKYWPSSHSPLISDEYIKNLVIYIRLITRVSVKYDDIFHE